MDTCERFSGQLSTAVACRAFGVARSSMYRRRRRQLLGHGESQSRRPSHRALSESQRRAVLALLNDEKFVDKAPAQVWASLIDEGVYHCSVRTMYRILKENGEARERRNQLRHPRYAKPELLATGPNEVWSWDITKLKGPVKWTYFYLYVLLDIFSRYVVGWMVAEREAAALAKELISQSYDKHRIEPGQLTVHADRGPSMKSKPVALLLADLGATKTHSRPHVSNDNPFSESQFKTMKYRPEFPERFGCIQDARVFGRTFFNWYNNEHYHSGLNLLTPAAVHFGEDGDIIQRRQRVLELAYARTPERFVNKKPKALAPPSEVWINPPHKSERA